MRRKENLIGRRFGKLTVIEESEPKWDNRGKPIRMMLCKCDCGKSSVVKATSLKSGHSKSCGCEKAAENLTGKRYGLLTVIDEAEYHITSGGRKLKAWKCRCDCGKEVKVTGNDLKQGNHRSCGCANKANYIGKTFGSLTVIDFSHKGSGKENVWVCKCVCGKIVTRASGTLTKRKNPSCGCGGTNIPIDGEEWRDCADYKGYEVSNLSRVRNKRTMRIVKPHTDNSGYWVLNMKIDGKIVEDRLHRIVAKAFIDNTENKKYINHIDGDKSNTALENLEWVTCSENAQHANRTGLVKHTYIYDRYQELAEQGRAKVRYECAYKRYRKGWSADDAITTMPLR